MEKINQAIIAIKLICATICSGVIGFLGGWDVALQVLLLLTAIDIITGFLKGIYTKQVTSGTMYRGFIKKIGMYLMVGVACLLDQFFNMNFIRSAAIGFYIATEGISIIENWGEMDLPLPNFIKDILVQLREQTNKGNKEDDANV